MNKQQFLFILQNHLTPISEDERKDLIADYESHFIHGLQNGKTEEQIAQELGDPFELVKEILGDRFTIQDPQIQVYHKKSISITRNIFVYIGLFFINIIIIPLLIGLWSGWIGLCAGTLGALLSPLLLIPEYLINHEFSVAKLFASIVGIGIGIWLFIAVKFTYTWLVNISRSYLQWNIKITKGEYS
ncbi:HAAS signaling domain-containing protein [Paenibacillus sp. FA6]|uniref:HAAS signaling domain-containing protein n=1 Tax=Paenibacillus sp. FA6 TaxID=3413029 RepID=UPI003F655306